jgi:uncharacterized membrane protein
MASRIVGVDLARGVALLTMAATHVLVVEDSDDRSLTVVGWLFAGRASALFAVLAGVSLALVTGGTRPVTGADRRRARVAIAVRALLIALLGLVLASSGTPVLVILAYYGVLFLVALPFLGLRVRGLVWWAVAWALLAPIVSALVRSFLSPMSKGQVDLGKLAERPLTSFTELILTGTYPAFTWTAYLLAGLAVGRMSLSTTRTAVRLMVTGTALAVVAWGSSALLLILGAAPSLTSPGNQARGWTWLTWLDWEGDGVLAPRVDALLLAVPHSGTTFDLVGTTGSALAVLGLSLLLVRTRWGLLLSRPVVAAGTMTLTLYSLHVLVLATEWGRVQGFGYYLAHVVIALVSATLWLHWFRRGPLEAGVHRVSRSVARGLVPFDPATSPAQGAPEPEDASRHESSG